MTHPNPGLQTKHDIAVGSPPDTTICLTMIVKNESDVIERCLASVAPVISHWVVVDTGSSDDTIALVKRALAHIPGRIVERPWVDFGYNRSEAITLAKGSCDYMLTIDADEVLCFQSGFRWPRFDADLYAIQTHVGVYTFARGYLMRASLPWRYRGVLHERPDCGSTVRTEWLENAHVMSYGDGGRSHLPNRFENEVSTLEKALADNPGDRAYRFFLANALVNLGEFERALELYTECIEDRGEGYVAWFSHYQTGLITERLGSDLTQATSAYARAFDHDPTRAEPLYRLVRAARLREDFTTGMALGEEALAIPKPKVFEPVDNEIYDYLLAAEYAICCQQAGQSARAIAVYDQLLARSDLPVRVRVLLENNRRLASTGDYVEQPRTIDDS